MPSDPAEDRNTPPQAKSRQERIRDNQRRSRARRQEYLVDLEKRLSECQITCRDADIQKAAFIELQIENTRLRELLSLAGVNDQFVDQYVSQAVAQGSHFPQGANPALRQLKPKIAHMPVDANRIFSNTATLDSSPATTGHPQAATSHANLTSDPSTSGPLSHSQNAPTINTTITSAPSSGRNLPDHSMPLSPTSSYLAMSPFAPSPLDANAATNFEWLYQQSPLPQSQNFPSQQPVACEAFGVTAPPTARVADDETILCSVAKQMVDQYHIPPAEMEQVTAKLSRGFCQPSYPGSDCAVDNQLLFQVLNELSAKYA